MSYTPPLAGGFIADEHAVRLGHGEATYRTACEALDAWVMFPTWAEVSRLEVKGQEVGQIVAMLVGEPVPDSAALRFGAHAWLCVWHSAGACGVRRGAVHH